MAEGFLYDRGDELITRENVSGVPVVTSDDAGKTAVVDSSGNWSAKNTALYVQVSYSVADKILAFGGGVKGKDIKQAFSDNVPIYFILRMTTTTTTAALMTGSIYRADYTEGTTGYLSLKSVPVALIPGTGTQDLYFITTGVTISSLSDNATSLAVTDANIVVVTLTEKS